MGLNNLICYEENSVKKWDVVKEKDRNTFLLELMQRPQINLHSIFIIPCNGIMGSIWLWNKTHKSSRVDFFKFFEEYGIIYEPPTVNETTQRVLDKCDQERKERDETKYGFISPDGRYFHCGYQGHTSLADKICFGMVDTNNAERYLEEHGWCKIYKSLFSDRYDIFVGGNYTLTDEQMKKLTEMELDNSESISRMLYKE